MKTIEDKQTRALLLAHPSVGRRETRSLTPKEENKFARVSYEHIANLLQFLKQGEAVTIESIDPITGKVIFIDGVNGRKVEPLTSLDYELRDSEGRLDETSQNEVYVKRSKSIYAQAYQ